MNSVIQFSGGRTSAFMLANILEQHKGLPGDFRVCFENTGKEREETLVFIEEFSQRWRVPITWLEYDDAFDIVDYTRPDGTLRDKKLRGPRFRVVTFETASRHGEPFLQLLRTLREYRKVIKGLGPVMPNPAQRICTAWLKIKICRSYLHSLGWDEWDLYMGIRADEAHRAAKMRASLPSYESLQTPLLVSGVRKIDVIEYWNRQPFNLQLDTNSDQGNCDLCFLKKTSKLVKIMRSDRGREQWWKDAETEFGGTFNRSKPSFHQLAAMIDAEDSQLDLYENNPLDQSVDCFCGE